MRNRSPWFIGGALVAVTLFATVLSLLLQRTFGDHIALIAVGPVICMFGVILFFAATSRSGTR